MFKVYYKENMVAEYESKESCDIYIQEELENNKEMREEDFKVYELVANTYGDNVDDYYEEEVVEDETEEDYDYDYEYEDEDYVKVETLQGVGVRDTENGFEILLIGVESGVKGHYKVETNIKGYELEELFGICSKISQRVHSLYYANNGNLTEEEVIGIVREEMIK